MLSWITNTIGNISSWLGDGVASLFNWLLSGLGTLLTKIINAFTGIWDVLDSIWDFAVSLVTNLMTMFGSFFPFVPASVLTVLNLGLIAVLIAGIVNKVRGK